MGVFTRAIRNLSRRKMRVLLVVFALGLSMAIMVSIPSGVVANQESAQRLNANYNATISIYQSQINQSLTLIECSLANAPGSRNFPGNFSSGGPGSFSGFIGGLNEQFMNESIMANITSIQGVQAVVPVFQEQIGTEQNITRRGYSIPFLRPNYIIVGVPLNSSLSNYTSTILPTSITQGRSLQEGDSGVVLFGLNNTSYFGVGVGGTASIVESSFKVVGIHGSSSSPEDSITLYMNISDAQRITNHTGEVSRFDVYARDTSVVAAVAANITKVTSKDYPDLSISTASSREAQLQDAQTRYKTAVQDAESSLASTQSTATQDIIIALVATSLIVLFVMLYTVRERTKEIGTLKAIGFSSWNIMSQFMLEGVILSLFAGLVGIAIGTVGASTLTSVLLPTASQGLFGGGSRFVNAGGAAAQVASSTPSFQIMLLSVGAAALLGALGSLYPAWRAARIRPAEAMRYE